MKKCPQCAEAIQDKAVKCKHCKSDLANNSKSVNTHKYSKSQKDKIWLTVLVVIVLFIVLGNFHIVFNVPTVFVSRPYFWFSDIIWSTNTCTAIPWLIAYSSHPSLCKALQNAWYLESTKDMQQRIQDDMQQSISCISKCDIYSPDHSDCLSNCY